MGLKPPEFHIRLPLIFNLSQVHIPLSVFRSSDYGEMLYYTWLQLDTLASALSSSRAGINQQLGESDEDKFRNAVELASRSSASTSTPKICISLCLIDDYARIYPSMRLDDEQADESFKIRSWPALLISQSQHQALVKTLSLQAGGSASSGFKSSDIMAKALERAALEGGRDPALLNLNTTSSSTGGAGIFPKPKSGTGARFELLSARSLNDSDGLQTLFSNTTESCCAGGGGGGVSAQSSKAPSPTETVSTEASSSVAQKQAQKIELLEQLLTDQKIEIEKLSLKLSEKKVHKKTCRNRICVGYYSLSVDGSFRFNVRTTIICTHVALFCF